METSSTPELTNQEISRRLVAGTILQARYRIVRELGTGGMGAVYEAIDQRLETTVALKETFSTDDRLRRQFEQEARLLARLQHPCLPRVTDYFGETGRAFLVMQFIAGPDLAQILSQRPGAFPPDQVVAWADQLLDALVYLHERDRQIIHRDIKPHNLKVMTSGRIALLDFGLAKTSVTEHSITNSSNSIFGYTRRYSPPEQISDSGTTAQSDIYALGATLYHLLTGMKPPDSLERAAAVANQDPDPLKPATEVNAMVDSALSTLIHKAMALTARERFKSAREFREALRLLRRKDLPALGPAGFLTADHARIVPVNKSDSALDPFDSYSILRPEQDVFNLPRGSRRPWLIAALVAIALVVLVSAYPSRVPDSIRTMPDSTRTTSPSVLTNGLGLHQNKTSPVIKPSPMRAGMAGVERDAQHKDDTQKRRSVQTPSKPEEVKPPPFSISPE